MVRINIQVNPRLSCAAADGAGGDPHSGTVSGKVPNTINGWCIRTAMGTTSNLCIANPQEDPGP